MCVQIQQYVAVSEHFQVTFQIVHRNLEMETLKSVRLKFGWKPPFRHTANWIRARLLTPKGPAVGDTLAVHTHVASPPLYRARENIGTHQLSKTSLSLAALCPNSHGPRPKH